MDEFDSLVEKFFPYGKWRKGQKRLSKLVYNGVKEGKIVLVNYPTGTGKTIAILSGILPLALEEGVKVFYAVRTRSQLHPPLRELSRIKTRLDLRVSVLVNKQILCLLDSMKKLSYEEFIKYCGYLSTTGGCPYAVNIYPGFKPPLALSLTKLKEYAKENKICPYVLASLLVRDSTVIVGTYSYLFDPRVRNAFFADTSLTPREIVLVVDEAHNLPGALVSMFSRELRLEWVRSARLEALQIYEGERLGELVDGLQMLENFMKTLRKRFGDEKVKIEPSTVIEVSPPLSLLESAVSYVESYYFSKKVPTRSYLELVYEFLSSLKTGDPRYVVESIGGEKIVNTCVSPAREVYSFFARIYGGVFMSGTLPPVRLLEFYTGIPEERIRMVNMPNPFASNVKLLSLSGISSRYVNRGEKLYQRIAEIIDELFSLQNRGVLLAVFPSYNFLRGVRLKIRSTPLFVERETTTLRQVRRFIEANPRCVIMVNAWGKVIEGVEFKLNGKNIIKTIVVGGLPIPEPSPSRDRLTELLSVFLRSPDEGWAYTYLIPAAMKIAQAIGRGVRSEEDRVFVVVLDERIKDEPVYHFLKRLGYTPKFVKEPKQIFVEYLKNFRLSG